VNRYKATLRVAISVDGSGTYQWHRAGVPGDAQRVVARAGTRGGTGTPSLVVAKEHEALLDLIEGDLQAIVEEAQNTTCLEACMTNLISEFGKES
jgi:hypothetical protein